MSLAKVLKVWMQAPPIQFASAPDYTYFPQGANL